MEKNLPVRPWGVETKEIQTLNEEFHSAIESKDPKKILAAQLKLADHYQFDRILLFENIEEVYGKERLKEIVKGTGQYVF